MTTAHYWSHCEMCGPTVICGKCGNNTCNAGYGELPDGSVCDQCPSANEKADAELMLNWRRRMWVRKAWAIHYYYIVRHAVLTRLGLA